MKPSSPLWFLGAIATLGLNPAIPAGETNRFSNGKNAASVIGQPDFVSGASNQGSATAANGFNLPEGIAIDPVTGNVFVADRINNRVLRFSSATALANGANAEGVLGQPDFISNARATTQNGMDRPTRVAVDSSGRLWVAEVENNRVLRFDNAAAKPNGANADGVLGQADFDTNATKTTQSGMNRPFAVAVDGAGRLWVCDVANHRVLRFDDAANKANGGNADGVLGQAVFTFGGSATAQGRFNGPASLSVDSAGRLWVADASNHRVLRFDDAAAKANGANADGVLGQADFDTATPGTTATTLMSPQGVVFDDPTGRLWVADRNNNRVLRFENAAAKADGAAADGALGQTDLTGNVEGLSRSGLNNPIDMLADGANRLWVVDRENHRILRFDTDRLQPDGRIGAKKSRQKGDDRYNRNGAGQKIKVMIPGDRAGKAFLTIGNDGDVIDSFAVTGTPGNNKLNVKYLRRPGGNVTGAMTRGGLTVDALAPGGEANFIAKIRGTRQSRNRRASRTLEIRARSQTDGETDTVKAKLKKTP